MSLQQPKPDDRPWMNHDLRTKISASARLAGKGTEFTRFLHNEVGVQKKQPGAENPVDAAWQVAFAKYDWLLDEDRIEPEPKPIEGEFQPPGKGGKGGKFGDGGTPKGAEAPPLTKAAIEKFEAIRAASGNDEITTIEEDILWAARYLDRGRVDDLDAPSESAWAMLHYARAYRTKFFEKFLPDAKRRASARLEAEREETKIELTDVDKRATASIRGMLKAAASEARAIHVSEIGEITGPYVGTDDLRDA